MPDVLATAECDEGHTWDVWGELKPNGRVAVTGGDLFCPECEQRAVSIEEKENLS